MEEVNNEQLLQELQSLNENTVVTNNTIKELQEYFILKDKKEQQKIETEKKQVEQAEKEQAEIQEQKEKEEASALAEKSARTEAETETYTELLTDIRDEQQFTNQMIAGSFTFFGIICGILLFKIIWDKLT